MKIIAIGSLGGTVSMTKSVPEEGVTPSLRAEDLLATIQNNQSLKNVEIISKNLFQVPSSHISFENILECYDWAKEQVEQGVQGIVLTQGTDTLEETAFLLDLIWDLDVPLVLTGAMRSPDQLSADGSANLLAALLVASADNSRNRGVLVVMNNWVYEAKWVEKKHTSDVDAFHSQVGPLGIVFEQGVSYFKQSSQRCYFPKPNLMNKKVFLYQATLNDTSDILDLIFKEIDGVVISGVGAGHVSKEVAEKLSIITEHIPVVIASSTLSGSTAYKTYGYIGSEMDLQKRGAVMSGWISPKKSRILATIALSNNADVADYFEQYQKIMTY
ncbi:asparaginase [Ignatzschineria sp. LJL83]